MAELLGGARSTAGTVDPAERTLVNVVEEMAIAAGVPVPTLYVLAGEEGINAFAAGFAPERAVIAVTRGAIDALTRDELQGVVAHELSHVVNSDTRLNLQLMALVGGLTWLALAGRFLVRMGFGGDDGRVRVAAPPGARPRDPRRGRVVRGLRGRFLRKAHPARRVADPRAPRRRSRGAVHAEPGRPRRRAREDRAAGLGPAQPCGAGGGAPLLRRRARVAPPRDAPAHRGADPAHRAAPRAAAPRRAAADPAGRRGTPRGRVRPPAGTGDDRAGGHACPRADRRASPALAVAAHDPAPAAALARALLADRDETSREVQLAAIGDAAQREEVARLGAALAGVDREGRMALLDLAAPALAQLARADGEALLRDLRALAAADGRRTVFEWAVERIVARRIAPRAGRSAGRVRRVEDVQVECLEILSLLAWLGAADAACAQAALDTALTALGAAGPWRILPRGRVGAARLEAALATIDSATPKVKERVLAACEACVGADGTVLPEEGEVLRAIAASLGVPAPPVPGAGERAAKAAEG